MSKTHTTPHALRVGHQSTFRRTVTVRKGKHEQRVQLVFEPETPLDLTDQEVAGLQREIALGLIVPWEAGNRRMRPVRAASEPKTTTKPVAPAEDHADDENELAAENARLGDGVLV